jgi:hypothetical protein
VINGQAVEQWRELAWIRLIVAKMSGHALIQFMATL